MKTCDKCPKYSTCKSLCPEAEAYANQDYVAREKQQITNSGLDRAGHYMGSFVLEKSAWEWSKSEYSSSELKRLIVQMHLDGKNQMEIAYYLPCSQPYINRIITKYKDKCLKL